MITITRPFDGEMRFSLAIGSIRIRVDRLSWTWTHSPVSIHKPIAGDLILSVRFDVFLISIFRRDVRLSRLSFLERLAHDLRQIRRTK